MQTLSGQDLEQVSGGVRTLQAVGDFMGFAAGASLLLGPEAIPLAMALGLGSAAFQLSDAIFND